MTQRATVPMILALVAIALGFATTLFSQKAATPPMIYAAAYVGMMFALYLGVRLWLPTQTLCCFRS